MTEMTAKLHLRGKNTILFAQLKFFLQRVHVTNVLISKKWYRKWLYNVFLAGLFHRGISQSGTAHCPWALTRPGLAKKNAQRLGQLMMCPTANSKDMLKCLQTRKPLDLIATDRAYQVGIENFYLECVILK